MPYAHEARKLKIPSTPGLDRRVKLSDGDRNEIRENIEGMTIADLAKEYGVSRRTVQFILFPEKLERNIALRKARGGSKVYYDRDKATEATRVHRRHKKKLYDEGKLQ